MVIKSKLPFNGDWLYVTENIPKDGQEKHDISDNFDKPEQIISQLESNDTDILKLTHKMSLDYYNSILSRSDRVIGKAKIIINSSAFISAVIIAISSSIVLINNSTELHWLFYIGCFFYIMTIIHLTRTLMLAISVIRREESIELSPLEIVEVAKCKIKSDLPSIYKDISSKMIAYANNTDKFILKRVNKLILSQTSFKYGIFYFVCFMILHFFILNINSGKVISLADFIKVYKENKNIEIKSNDTRNDLIQKFINKYDTTENNKLKLLKKNK